jgi:hypothetical protein
MDGSVQLPAAGGVVTAPDWMRQRRDWVRQRSLTAQLAALALLVALAGSIFLGIRHTEKRTVVVATRALDAFGVARQLETKPLDHGSLPSAPVVTIGAAQDHYILRSVKAGDALAESDIGPKVRSASDVVVAIPLTTEQSSGLSAGQVVDLLLAPSVAQVGATVICTALVVDVDDSSSQAVAYMAIPRTRELRVAGVIARGMAIIARRP